MHPKTLFGTVLMLIAVLISACNINANATASNTTFVTTTNCPGQERGRAAVMPALTSPQHQDVAYLWQDHAKTVLSEYDTQTGNKKKLLTFTENDNVNANVSPDGHWIIVTQSTSDLENAIKLVRIDGAYAQTLYCSTSDNFLSSALLSPNQHSLVFSEVNPNTQTFTLNKLDMSTGKVQALLSSLQPGYPGVPIQPQAIGDTSTQASSQQPQANIHYYSQLLMPQSGKPPITGYIPFKWAGNSSLYLQSAAVVPSGGGAFPNNLYQLLDINKPVEQQSNNVKSLTAALKQGSCYNYDITADHTQLICSMGPSNPLDPTQPGVGVAAVNGTSLHNIFTASSSNQMVLASTPSGHMVLFIVNDVKTKLAQFYQINSNGTALKLITSAKAAEYAYEGYGARKGYANVLHDGKYYALLAFTNSTNMLVIGKLAGGSPTTTKISDDIETRIVGWTAA
ncbi:hypothetical protein KDA_44470 [Dictyobacter alpinus]|uniref:Lipoprotein LpqB beta-propeller domain-containing protein n=1 Tax=Dictyobacter alpinus TaxID=2014873 RepID=A0A402BC54_9CHLR|nr:hypothetical protein [Dictyobacter alpinus]GCE28963.1 hypothetical protein KDA_44470 [Dictyobacter alpinus]